MSLTARCSVAFATFLAVVLLHPSRAHADPAAAGSTADHWYGWQSLTVDGASLVIGLGVGGLHPEAGVATFVAGYTLGGPIVHLVHHRPLAAIASLGLRVGVPVALTVVGATIGLACAASSNGDGDALDSGFIVGVVFGSSLGAMIASTVDSAVLAREPADAPPASSPSRTTALAWTPTFALVRDPRTSGSPSLSDASLRTLDGAVIGVRGTF